MKTPIFVFIIFFLCIYAAANLYLFVRGWQSLEIFGRQRVWFTVIFWAVVVSCIITQLLQFKGISGNLYDVFFTVSAFWIAVMLYGFIILFAIDILRLLAWATNIKPDFLYRNYPLTKALIFVSTCLIFAVILLAGYLNAHRPHAVHLQIPVHKQAGELSSLRVVMVSDIHLGHINGRKSLQRIVTVINEQKPDIVLLAGDTFDGTPGKVIKKDMCVEFQQLQTRFGVYAVSGNHEYIGNRGNNENAVDTAFAYLESRGVQPLQDTVVLIDNSFYVVGRKDRMAGSRKTIPELLNGIDRQKPIVMLDHQPYHLEAVEQAGVDLQLSGHTHHGQMWPVNYITAKMYERDWGFLQRGKSYFYISCGAGTWGPPIRTAGHSEIVVIDMEFAF